MRFLIRYWRWVNAPENFRPWAAGALTFGAWVGILQIVMGAF